jgi:GNAT superfamily N-acetyltransferase
MTRRGSRKTIAEQVAERFAFDRMVLAHAGVELPITREDEDGWFVRRVRSQAFGIRYAEDSDDEQRVLMGSVDAALFLGSLAETCGVDLVWEADAIDGELCSVAELLYADDGLLSSETLIADTASLDALYIHHVRVEPAFRGARLGELLMNHTIAYHDPTRLAAVLLFVNSQYEMPKDDPFAGAERAKGDRKLAAYYAALGFRPVPGHRGYMFADLTKGYDVLW